MKGKTKMQALLAVMRKTFHGMPEHDQEFDGERFFVCCVSGHSGPRPLQ
jgi:hypothetical protein